jgi:hypothetical protein
MNTSEPSGGDQIRELIYGPNEVWQLIKDKWPQAEYTDASDYIHEERFEVTIPNVTDDEFFPFAILEGFFRCCFSMELNLRMGERKEDIERWIEIAKKMKEELENTTSTP